jgi:hypothetical protein
MRLLIYIWRLQLVYIDYIHISISKKSNFGSIMINGGRISGDWGKKNR